MSTTVRLPLALIARDLRDLFAHAAADVVRRESSGWYAGRPATPYDFDIEVRLQVRPDGSWQLHTGDASYDTDHHGVFAATTLSAYRLKNGRIRLARINARDLARQLINDAVDMAVDGGVNVNLAYVR